MTDHTPQRRRLATLFAPLLAFGGFAAATTSSFAQPALPRPGPVGDRMARHGMDREAMQERMLERRTSHMLDAVEATPAQRSAIVGIVKAAWKDIKPMRDQQRASREKGRELMFAATIDRTAIEQLRAAQSKLHDAMGQRKLAGMLDAMQALTPEQRAKLAAGKRQHRGMSGWGGMGEGQGHPGMRGGMPPR